MDGLIEEHVIADAIQIEDKKFGERPSKVHIPRGKYILCHLVFFLLGVCHFLPITFFSAANNFWLYKFRNVSDTEGSAENRTFLQKNFASFSQIASTVPALAFGVFNITLANRFSITGRLIVSLTINFLIFIFLTASVKINTDNVQVLFYVVVLIAYTTLSGSNAINMLASMNLYPRFPHAFMKTCLVGEGTAGIFGDVLNVITVYMYTNDITDATLLYFIFGGVVVGLTLLLTIIVSRMSFFNECLDSLPLNAEKKIPSKKILLGVFGKIRNIIALLGIIFVGMAATHSAITALVVSEHNIKTSSWAKNYFSPVMTFLLGDAGMLVGRLLSSYVPLQMSDTVFLILSILKSIVFVPLVWLCNAQPRNHLPVVFSHDYQYGLIFGIFMITNGYFINMSTLLIPQKVEKHEADVAYPLFGLMLSIIQTLCAPIGLFVVNVL